MPTIEVNNLGRLSRLFDEPQLIFVGSADQWRAPH